MMQKTNEQNYHYNSLSAIIKKHLPVTSDLIFDFGYGFIPPIVLEDDRKVYVNEHRDMLLTEPYHKSPIKYKRFSDYEEIIQLHKNVHDYQNVSSDLEACIDKVYSLNIPVTDNFMQHHNAIKFSDRYGFVTYVTSHYFFLGQHDGVNDKPNEFIHLLFKKGLDAKEGLL